jgi:hypothetical protein
MLAISIQVGTTLFTLFTSSPRAQINQVTESPQLCCGGSTCRHKHNAHNLNSHDSILDTPPPQQLLSTVTLVKQTHNFD